jgi:hypothetical protein
LTTAIAVFQNPTLTKDKTNSLNWLTSGQLITLIPFLALMIACPLLVLFYICHGMCCANDINYLSNIMTNVGDPNKSNADEYFEMVTREKASLVMHVDCYHYERRTTGSGKNRRTRRVKVTTYRGARNVNFNDWSDQTDSPKGLEAFSVVKVLSIKDPITFADQYTSEEVNKQREQFKAENRNRDRYMAYSEIQDIKTFKKNVLFVRNDYASGNCSILSQRTYQICTMCCCNWLYRYWFEWTAVRTTVHVSKVIKCIPGNMNYVMGGGGGTGGVKAPDATNYEFNVLLQQLQTSFMNGQMTAHEFELAQQQLTAQYGTANATPSAPAVGVLQRRPTLSAADARRIQKQGGANGTKCKWCFCGILVVVGIPLLLWFGALGCGDNYRKTRWCQDNNDQSDSYSSTDKNQKTYIENYKFNVTLMYGDLCAGDSGAAGRCTSPSSTCKEFTAFSNCQDAFDSFTPTKYDNAVIYGCDKVITSGTGGFCTCTGTGSTPTYAISVACGHPAFTCKEMCENKCANGAACVNIPGVGDACVLPELENKYEGYYSYSHGMNLNPFWIPTMTCKAYPAVLWDPNKKYGNPLYYPTWKPQLTLDAVTEDIDNDGRSAGAWNKWSNSCSLKENCQRWRNDGKCDKSCNSAACGWDGLDCDV